MSPPDYDANLIPAPSLTREFEAIPGYHETQVRAAFKARYSKAVEEIVKDIAPTDFRCLFVSTKENFSVRTNQRGSNMQGGTRTVASAVAGTYTQMGSSPQPRCQKLLYNATVRISPALPIPWSDLYGFQLNFHGHL